MFEIGFDPFGAVLQFHHRASHLGFQFIAVYRWLAAMDLGLEVAVEVFVGVEFRRVGWQEEEFDVLWVLFQPGADLFAVMHLEVVQNQEDFLACVPDEAGQEADQHRRGQRFPVEHEAHLSLVGDESWSRLFGQNFHGDKWSPAGIALSTVTVAEGPFRP